MAWEQVGTLWKKVPDNNPILGCIILFIILALFGSCG